jgi:hypothetical protein
MEMHARRKRSRRKNNGETLVGVSVGSLVPCGIITSKQSLDFDRPLVCEQVITLAQLEETTS